MTKRRVKLHTPWGSYLSRCSWSWPGRSQRSQLPCIRGRLCWHVQIVPTQQRKSGLLRLKSVADLPEIGPRLGLTHVDDTSLGTVVGSLQLRDVDNMSAHAGGSHEATIGEALELLAVHIGTLLLLAPPVRSSGPGTVESAVEVGGHNLVVVGDFTIEHGTLRPWDTSVGNENVETTIELLGNLVDRFLDTIGICDVYLVGLAWLRTQSVHEQQHRFHDSWQYLTLDAISLLDVLSAFNGFFVAVVPDGDIGS